MSQHKYAELIKAGTQYARRMNHLSNRIFGEVTRTTNSKSMKVLRMFSEEPTHKREYIINWYPRHMDAHKLIWNLRQYGLFRDEHEDFKEEMDRLRRLRGKGPPKKGEGKRASKK